MLIDFCIFQVNPNSVMPLTLVTVPSKPSSPLEIKSESSKVTKPEVKQEIKHVINVADNKKPIGKTIKIATPSAINKSIVRSTQTENKGMYTQLRIWSGCYETFFVFCAIIFTIFLINEPLI